MGKTTRAISFARHYIFTKAIRTSLFHSYHSYLLSLFPQIAIAIGVLTSNTGGRRTTLADWTWHQGATAGCRGRGAIAVPLQGAIVVCWRVTTNFWGVDVVPLQGAIAVTANFGGVRGAIAGCHCSVLWGDHELWGSEQTWCHCWVPLQGAIVGYGLGGG